MDINIYTIRGQRVVLDADLARIYGVETKIFNQAIRRNEERFPEEFMFQLTMSEFTNLRSQIVTSRWGGRRYKPFVFTEHGAVMLASVLRSKLAIKMSIEVVKTFVKMRQILASHENIEKQIAEIRSFILKQSNKSDCEFKKVWKAIDGLTDASENGQREAIGFKVD